MFQDNSLRQEVEFDFGQSRLWEKRDSEKVVNDNKAELKLLSEYDELYRATQQQNICEEEMHWNDTKPCFSIKGLPALGDELASVSDFPLQEEELNSEKADEEEIAQESKNQPVEEDKNQSGELSQGKVTSQQDIRSDKNDLLRTTKEEVAETLSKTKPSTQTASILIKKDSARKQSDADGFEWNNFLVRRAWFRGVSVYYKSRFSKINTSWQRKRVNKKKKTPMHVLIKEFATQEFGDVVERLTEEQWVSFRNTLYSILFSHRYKKADDFLEGVNFSLIRGVLYSYTTDTRVELMSDPFFSLMILNFLRKGKEEFIKSKVKDKPKLYSEELKAELTALEEEAKGFLTGYNFFE